MRLILVSTSPQRRALIAIVANALGYSYECVDPQYDEQHSDRGNVYRITRDMAQNKLYSVPHHTHAEHGGHQVYIGADTLVSHRRRIFSKPRAVEEAIETITYLQGKIHKVVTAVAIALPSRNVLFTATSWVAVRSLTQKQIIDYCNTNDWRGSSGGYKLQGSFSCHVRYILGAHTNIIGLPVAKIFDKLV